MGKGVIVLGSYYEGKKKNSLETTAQRKSELKGQQTLQPGNTLKGRGQQNQDQASRASHRHQLEGEGVGVRSPEDSGLVYIGYW